MHVNWDSTRYHFDSIAHDNDAQSYTIGPIVALDQSTNSLEPITLEGEQMVPKFNKTTPDKVQVLLALFRIRDKKVDLVLSANIPIVTADGSPTNAEGVERARNEFGAAARTLQIVDYNLFA